MAKFILGKKVGMTQLFDETGVAIPVTVVEAGPLTVAQIKSEETDGYSAVRVGFGDVKEKSVNKPDAGLYKKIGKEPKKYLREFRIAADDSFELGQEINVAEMFAQGDKVDVTGTTKGKGFQGAIKRHNQHRGKMTHGSHYHRGPGSMGGCSDPGKVFKGKKLPGHMGCVKVTIQNLDVVRVDGERNFMLIKGSVPGAKGGLLMVKSTVKGN